jgi:hypothetical protein
MSQSLIVLIGAGLTLFLGFVFGRVPATRKVDATPAATGLIGPAAGRRRDDVRRGDSPPAGTVSPGVGN